MGHTGPVTGSLYLYLITYTDPWNVWTVLKPGKMQELAEQVANAQLKIDTIQETR